MKTLKLKKLFRRFKKQFKSFKQELKADELEKAYKELQSSYSSLTSYKELLEQRVQEEISKRQLQEKILAQQARLAAMGEMIDAIAHQWSQPLTIIDMNINLIPDDFRKNLVDEDYILTTVDTIHKQTKHLQKTLKNFRNFLSPIDKSERFEINNMIQETLLLLDDEIMRSHIQIDVLWSEKSFIHGSENELMHVLINLINNAKEAFEKNDIKDRTITIHVKNKISYVTVTVQDNAGGIEKSILSDLFKPYVSTKESDETSGIGLYMSSLIMQKHSGKIDVKSIKNGAKFIMKFYKE